MVFLCEVLSVSGTAQEASLGCRNFGPGYNYYEEQQNQMLFSSRGIDVVWFLSWTLRCRWFLTAFARWPLNIFYAWSMSCFLKLTFRSLLVRIDFSWRISPIIALSEKKDWVCPSIPTASVIAPRAATITIIITCWPSRKPKAPR